MDEVFDAQVLQKSSNQKQEDSFDIFGKHIANEIRSFDNANAQCWVKFKIQEIIFKPNSTLTFRPIQNWLVSQHHKDHHRTLAILPFLIRSNHSRIIHHWEKDKCMNHHNPCIVSWVVNPPQTWKWETENNEQSTTLVFMCIFLKSKNKTCKY